MGSVRGQGKKGREKNLLMVTLFSQVVARFACFPVKNS